AAVDPRGRHQELLAGGARDVRDRQLALPLRLPEIGPGGGRRLHQVRVVGDDGAREHHGDPVGVLVAGGVVEIVLFAGSSGCSSPSAFACFTIWLSMYATSSSARPPAARSFAMVCTELPSTYFTVDPVAFSKAAAWHFFELSTKVPPKVPTTSSSAETGSARPTKSRHVSTIDRRVVMVAGPLGVRGWRDYSRAAPGSQPLTL